MATRSEKSSDLRERRAYKKPNFITPGGSRLSDLDDDDLQETFKAALPSRKKAEHDAAAAAKRHLQKLRPGSSRSSGSSGKQEKVGILFKLTVCQHIMLLLGLMLFGIVTLLVFMQNPIDPVIYQLGPQPAPVGTLAANTRLAETRKLLVGAVRGPESFAFAGEYMFTGTMDGKIVRVNLNTQQQELWVRFGPANCSTAKSLSQMCGRPLGLRRHPTNASRLLVADAYLGLMDVSLETRTFRPLIDRTNPVGATFYDDLDITPDGIVFLSDASTKFPMHIFMQQVLEGSSNGRLLMLNLTSGHVAPVLEGLSFANGVQLHPDGQSVLVSETTAFRIVRYYFAGPRAGQSATFAENLPIGPDNLRLASDGRHLWVAGIATRLAGLRSWMDLLSERTWVRLAAAKLIPGPLLHQLISVHHGLVLKLSLDDGRVVESLHDPEGREITHSTEVHEHNGRLYIGTYYASYIGMLSL